MDEGLVNSKSRLKRIAAQKRITVCQKCYGSCGVTDGQTGEYRQCPKCGGEGVENLNQSGREGSGVEGSCLSKSGCGCD